MIVVTACYVNPSDDEGVPWLIGGSTTMFETAPEDASPQESGNDLLAIARAYLDYVARRQGETETAAAC